MRLKKRDWKIETERKKLQRKSKQLHKELKDLDRKISDYRVALNHAKGREEPPLPSNPKFRNLRFKLRLNSWLLRYQNKSLQNG